MGRRRSSANPSTTVVVIQDSSGSMHNRRNATVSGYNEYVGTLRAEAEGDVRLTLVQFASYTTTRYSAKPLSAVPALQNGDYVPGGMTALYDAVGKAVRTTESQVGKNEKVVVVIMTDGGENSSREYKHEDVLSLLESKRREGWEFIFFGAGEEAWNAGQNLGFTYDTSINYGMDDYSHQNAFQAVALASAGATRGMSTSNYLSTSPIKSALESASGFTTTISTISTNTTKYPKSIELDANGVPVTKSQ
jgi:uncharacterized protein YegL